VVDQLVAHVSPLAGAAEGTHELTLELRPAELGAVRLEVTLDDGVLSVRVHADDPASRRLLAQSLGDLRHALADAGISAGSLDVGDPHAGAEARGRDGDRSSPGRGGDRPPAADDAPRPARGRASSTSAVDVLL
jgi:flagellar hook-length control protein FliK